MAGRGTSSIGFMLANILRKRIASGRYKQQFPTENDLIGEFGMSRYAVRSALQRLESDGQIDRQPGRGTKVVNQVPDSAAWAIRTVEDLIDCNLQGRATVLSAKSVASRDHPGIAHVLGLNSRGKIFVIERLSHSQPGNIPFFSRTFMPVAVGLSLARHGTSREPLAVQIERSRKIRLHRVRQDISGARAAGLIADRLKVPADAPIVVVRRTYFGWDGDAVVLGDLFYRLDEFRQAIDLFRHNT